MKVKKLLILFLVVIFSFGMSYSNKTRPRARDLGIKIGILQPGKYNAITDVTGVLVGQETLIFKDHIRTGVTVIKPHPGNIFNEKVPAAVYVGNGFGKFIGSTQINELGNIETPILLTNTLSVWTAANGLIDYTLGQNPNATSINPVVGETNDSFLNDIRGRHIKKHHIKKALENAHSGLIKEGCVGAGTGTSCLGFKGGIGTSSRIIPKSKGGFTVGVLVQSNFGGILNVNGIPVGKELKNYYLKNSINKEPKGSCMIIVATDAPLNARNLKRLAKRAMLGFGRIGGISSNGSGDYVIAFSTFKKNRIKSADTSPQASKEELKNSKISPLFLAVIEATEEALLNSLLKATTTKGFKENTKKALSIDKLKKLLKKYKRKDSEL